MAYPFNTASRIPCEVLDCNTDFARMADMQRHVKDYHGGPYLCPEVGCPWPGSKRKARLDAHLRKKHAAIYCPRLDLDLGVPIGFQSMLGGDVFSKDAYDTDDAGDNEHSTVRMLNDTQVKNIRISYRRKDTTVLKTFEEALNSKDAVNLTEHQNLHAVSPSKEHDAESKVHKMQSRGWFFLLLDDAAIKSLCTDALATVVFNRFERNLRRLLKEFALGLRKEAKSEQERHAAQFVRLRARNSAHIICTSLTRKEKTHRVNDLEVENLSDDSDSDRPEDEVDDLQQLEMFIKSSWATETFRENLRSFVRPEEHVSYSINADVSPDRRTLEQLPEVNNTANEKRRLELEILDPLRAGVRFDVMKTSWRDRFQTTAYTTDEPKASTARRSVSEEPKSTYNGRIIEIREDHPWLEETELDQSPPLALSGLFRAQDLAVQQLQEHRDEEVEKGIITLTEIPKKVELPNLIAKWLGRGESIKGIATSPSLLKWMGSFLNSRSSIVPAGKTRIEWQCKCGRIINDDFTEPRAGAADRFRQKFSSTPPTHSPSESSSFKNLSRTFSSGLESLRNIFSSQTDKDLGSELPIHETRTASSPTDTRQLQPEELETPVVEPLFLLVWYDEGKHATRLLHVDLAILQAESDKALFEALRKSFYGLRASWVSWLSLRTLESIKFVHFEIYKSEFVDVRKQDEVPPPHDTEYRYKPAPPEIMPLEGCSCTWTLPCIQGISLVWRLRNFALSSPSLSRQIGNE